MTRRTRTVIRFRGGDSISARNLFLISAILVLSATVMIAIPAADGASEEVHSIYDTLNDEEKAVYDELDKAVRSHGSIVNCEGFTREEGIKIDEAYRFDNPDCWWYFDNWNLYVDKNTGMCDSFRNDKMFSMSEIDACNMSIKSHLPKIDMSDADSEYMVALNIHNWLCDNVVYLPASSGDPKDHATDIYGAFVEGEAVCEGYTMAFTYLGRQYGLDCFGVFGTTVNTTDDYLHSWNMVKIDGEWYFVDVTWDDNEFSRSLRYFLVGSETVTMFGAFSTEDHVAGTLYGIVPSAQAYSSQVADMYYSDVLIYSGAEQDIFAYMEGCTATGNTATLPGSYVAVLTLDPGYVWPDGSTDEMTIEWKIVKESLSARYEGETIAYGEAPSLSVTVTGFVGGEDESTASGYVAPTVKLKSTEPGVYELYPEGGYSDCYEFYYFPGVLTIESAPAVDPPVDPVVPPVDPSDPTDPVDPVDPVEPQVDPDPPSGDTPKEETDSGDTPEDSSGGEEKKSSILMWIVPIIVVMIIIGAIALKLKK